MKDLCISIVNTNNREMLRNCLKSICETTRDITFEVRVMDNCSNDDSADMVVTEFPDVELKKSSVRRGFSANHNDLLSGVSSRYILLLNEDVIVTPYAFTEMVRFMDANPRIGILGCKVFGPTGRIEGGHFVKPLGLLAELGRLSLVISYISKLFPKLRYMLQCHLPREDYEKSQEVFSVHGSCMMIRRKTWDEVGPLDEGYFIYYEEPDYSTRARLKGWKTFHCADACIIHFGGQTMKKKRRYSGVQNAMQSMYRYHLKFHGRAYIFLLWLCYFFLTMMMIPLLPSGKFIAPNRWSEMKNHWISRLLIMRWHLTSLPPFFWPKPEQ